MPRRSLQRRPRRTDGRFWGGPYLSSQAVSGRVPPFSRASYAGFLREAGRRGKGRVEQLRWPAGLDAGRDVLAILNRVASLAGGQAELGVPPCVLAYYESLPDQEA